MPNQSPKRGGEGEREGERRGREREREQMLEIRYQ